MDSTIQMWLVIFVGVAAFSLLLQTLLMVGMAVGARRMQVKAEGLLSELRSHALPILSSSRTVIEDLTPKIKTISTNLTESSNKVRTMAVDISGAVGDVTARTKMQAAHVDGMVDGALDRISSAGNTIQHGISVPIRQVTAIVNAVRAGWSVMCGSSPARRDGKDLFV